MDAQGDGRRVTELPVGFVDPLMKLTDSELRFVSKCQRYQRWWPRLRWFSLAASIATILAYSIILNWLISYPVNSPEDAAAVGWASPIAWACLFVGSGWLGLTIVHWRGDVKTRLLLKLVEEHEERKS